MDFSLSTEMQHVPLREICPEFLSYSTKFTLVCNFQFLTCHLNNLATLPGGWDCGRSLAGLKILRNGRKGRCKIFCEPLHLDAIVRYTEWYQVPDHEPSFGQTISQKEFSEI